MPKPTDFQWASDFCLNSIYIQFLHLLESPEQQNFPNCFIFQRFGADIVQKVWFFYSHKLLFTFLANEATGDECDVLKTLLSE